jgi:predicted transcriptional regulator
MDLRPTERDVLLDLHRNGDNIQSNISDSTERTQKSVSTAIERLRDRGLVESKGRGVYRLTDEGVETAQTVAELRDL